MFTKQLVITILIITSLLGGVWLGYFRAGHLNDHLMQESTIIIVYILYKCNDTDDVDGISAQSTMVPYLPCLCTRVYPQQLTIYTSYLTLPYLPINTVCNCTYKDRFSTQIQIIFFFFFIRVPEYKFEQCKSRSGKMCKVQRYLSRSLKVKC